MSLMELGGNSVDGPYSRFQCFKPAEPHSPLFPGLYFPSNCLTPENWTTEMLHSELKTYYCNSYLNMLTVKSQVPFEVVVISTFEVDQE